MHLFFFEVITKHEKCMAGLIIFLNTKKRTTENLMHSGVFFKNFQVLENVVKNCLVVFDIFPQSKLKRRGK